MIDDILSWNHATYGERRLIASIINQAIIDAMKCKNPKYYFSRKECLGLSRSNKKIKLVLVKNIIDSQNKNKFTNEDIDFLLLCIKVIDFNRKCSLLRDAKLSINARAFINKYNEIFSLYCHLINLDPESLAEACHKYFYKYDNGLIEQPIF